MQKASEDNQAQSNTEAAILGAASLLFSENGFDAVSMRMIAEQAEVSKANVFHHFGSKESLYIAVMREAIQRSSASLRDTPPLEGGAVQALKEFSTQHLKVMLENPDCSRLMLREVLDTKSGRGQKLANEVVGDSFSRLVSLLEKGQASGELREDFDPAIAAALFVAADLFFFEASPVLKHLPDASFANHPSKYTAGLLDIFLHGIASKT